MERISITDQLLDLCKEEALNQLFKGVYRGSKMYEYNEKVQGSKFYDESGCHYDHSQTMSFAMIDGDYRICFECTVDEVDEEEFEITEIVIDEITKAC